MNFTFNLSVADVELISQALSELPHGRVNGLINRLQAQVNAQLQPQTLPNPISDKKPAED